MKIIFSKFNRDRLEKFQIMTTFLKKDSKELIIRKQPLTKKSEEHLQKLYENYEILKNRYNFAIYSEPTKENKMITFRYIEGDTFSYMLNKAVLKNDMKTFFKLLKKYVSILDNFVSLKKGFFKPSREFINIFGESKEIKDVDIITLCDIDMIFSNIVFKEDRLHCFDYEWVFNFSIPKKYVLWRAIEQDYVIWKGNIKQSKEELLEEVGISRNMDIIFRGYEKKFVEYVYMKGAEKVINRKKFEKNKINLVQEYLLQKKMIESFSDRQNSLKQHIQSMETSKSWRVTYPLRKLGDLLR